MARSWGPSSALSITVPFWKHILFMTQAARLPQSALPRRCNLNAHGPDTKGDPPLLGPGCCLSSCPFGPFLPACLCACPASLPVLRPRPAAAGYRPIRPVLLAAASGPTYAERDHGRSPSAFFGVPGLPCRRRGPPARPTAENRKLTYRLAAWGGGG